MPCHFCLPSGPGLVHARRRRGGVRQGRAGGGEVPGLQCQPQLGGGTGPAGGGHHAQGDGGTQRCVLSRSVFVHSCLASVSRGFCLSVCLSKFAFVSLSLFFSLVLYLFLSLGLSVSFTLPCFLSFFLSRSNVTNEIQYFEI